MMTQRHLGDALPTARTITSAVGSGVAITQGAISTGLITSATLSAAIPIIGLAVAGVTLAIGLLFARKKPGQKRATTAIVNDIEPQLQANKDAYFSGPRTVSSREQALNNFDAGWAYLVDQCAAPRDLNGEPGSWCIEDRMAVGQMQPSHNGLGPWIGNGKWNWFSYYRDPIEQDVPVPDPIDPVSSILSGEIFSGSNTPLLFAVGAGLLLLLAVKE